MNNTVCEIKKYRELKADIEHFDIMLEEVEEWINRISAQSQVEKLIDQKKEIQREKASAIRRIKKIENALSILTDEERLIIQVAIIDCERYWRLEEKLNLTYSRIKQIENKAIKKMEKYFI